MKPDPALAELPDEKVVRLVLRGREDLYAILVDRYRRRIVGHLMRYVGKRDDALDIAQEVFLKVYQNLARFDPSYRFSTWIYSIASNAAIDKLRRKKVPTTSLDQPISTDDGEIAREPVGPARTADEIVGAEDLMAEVESAIQRLPDQYRELILLRHPGGRSYDEIASITGLPLGTVKNRIFRARQRLRDDLGDLLPAGT
ncbi:MAG: sigma-70 family RNA polymerase sigma factor [Acidobacteriota bacterium]